MIRAALSILLLTIIAGCGDVVAPIAPKIIKTQVGAEMVLIPAGSFRMGSHTGKPDEGPIHTIKLDAFLMDRTEVTLQMYALLKISDRRSQRIHVASVQQVSWTFAAMFCNADRARKV